MSFDVVTVGEAMLRLGVAAGAKLEKAERLDVHVAGAEANTAVALAQLGRSVTWLSRLPDSPLGRRVARELRASGVDISLVRWVPESRMGVYYVELATPPRQVKVVYDRARSAASDMVTEDFPTEVVAAAKIVHLSGITPALSEDCRRLSFEIADRARAGSGRLTVDVNYRSKLWSPEAANECLTQLATGADLVALTQEDARDVFGLDGEPADVVTEARKKLEAGTVVLTLGDRGSVWDSGDASGQLDALPTEIVDRLGAGDAFMAGVIDGLLDNDLEIGLRRGTALASLALGSHGDHVLTTRDEVERLIEGGGRAVDR